MTVLVTGGSGFVGSAVVRRLLAEDASVRVLVRTSSPKQNLASLPVEIVVGDLLDRASLTAALRGIRELYHVAADYRLWARDPRVLHAVNVEGTRTLLTLAGDAGVERIVHTSSVATLGLDPDGRPADEQTPVTLADMIGPYKRSKFLAEQAARELAAEGLPVVIVNPSTPVGPRDIRPTPTGEVIRKAATGRIPAYVDTGLNIVHVDDVAEGHLLACRHGRPGERYILGGDNLSLRDILTEIARITGRAPPRIQLPRAPLMPLALLAETAARFGLTDEPFLTRDGLRMARKKMFFRSTKAERELGYRHRPAVEALADAVADFLTREAGAPPPVAAPADVRRMGRSG